MMIEVPIPELHRRQKISNKHEEFSSTFGNIFGGGDQAG